MNTNPAVDAWFEAYDNPQKAGVQRVREIILATDDRITEAIKWKAPTFIYKGNIASFYPKAKKHVSLMFHRGAHIPGDHPLLEGQGDTSRTAKFADVADIEAKRAELEGVIRAWCAARDA
jgi:hypothetical protein